MTIPPSWSAAFLDHLWEPTAGVGIAWLLARGLPPKSGGRPLLALAGRIAEVSSAVLMTD